MKQYKGFAKAVLLTSMGALLGCTTSVSRISDDGKSDEIVFPDIQKSAWVKEGTFPSVDGLRLVAPGMTKDQIRALFGSPHFREGMMGVREWDYIFNFRHDGGVATCQYKLIYGPDYKVRSMHWQPASCADYLKPPAPPAPVVVDRVVERVVERPAERPAVEVRRIRLGTDGLFVFDKSSLADLLPGGVARLDQLAADLLTDGEIDQVRIVGHADRLGSDEYNLALSQARADTIRSYLASKGIQADRISAGGVGSTQPVVECTEKNRPALIACLQPNRRVEIQAWVVHK